MNLIATAFIKEHEACRLTAYQDGGGVWTVGWGATGPDVGPTTVWTQTKADARLALDQAKVEHSLLSLVHVPLTQDQWAGLISLAFNVGSGAVASSVLLVHLNAKSWCAAVREWIDFDHNGGHEVKGLLCRRLDECALFLKATP